jgi:PAS domain S-box-containing protein
MDIMMPEMDGMETMREIRKIAQVEKPAHRRGHSQGHERRPGEVHRGGGLGLPLQARRSPADALRTPGLVIPINSGHAAEVRSQEPSQSRIKSIVNTSEAEKRGFRQHARLQFRGALTIHHTPRATRGPLHMTADDRINILVVDDLPDKLLVLESVLAELNENVICARSGAEALQQVLKHDFAVILLDVNMPDMDGYETASLIRSRKRSAHTPIIFVTGYADEVHRAQGYSLGAVDYVLSPVSPEILRTKVKVFVDLARMSAEVKRHADHRVELAKEQAAREAAERMAEALRASEERFRLASEAVNGFIYEVDVPSGRMVISPGLKDLLGVSPEEIPTLERWQERLHPDDRRRIVVAREEALREGSRRYHCEYRVRSQDRRYLNVWDQGLAAPGADGKTVRLVGNVVDITEHKRIEEVLAESIRRKDEFLAMLAHELRNPLAPIRRRAGELEFAGRTSAEDPRIAQWAADDPRSPRGTKSRGWWTTSSTCRGSREEKSACSASRLTWRAWFARRPRSAAR